MKERASRHMRSVPAQTPHPCESPTFLRPAPVNKILTLAGDPVPCHDPFNAGGAPPDLWHQKNRHVSSSIGGVCTSHRDRELHPVIVLILLTGSVRGRCSTSLCVCSSSARVLSSQFSQLAAATTPSMASDLGPFEVGQILALHREGYSHRQIADRVTRGRDQPGPKLFAVGEAVRRLGADPTWTGSQKEAGDHRKQVGRWARDGRWPADRRPAGCRTKARCGRGAPEAAAALDTPIRGVS